MTMVAAWLVLAVVCLMCAGVLRLITECRALGNIIVLIDRRAAHLTASVNRVADEMGDARIRMVRDAAAVNRNLERIGNKLETLAALQRQSRD